MRKLERRNMSDAELQILLEGFDEEFFDGRIRKQRGQVKARFVPSKELNKANKDYDADAGFRPRTNEILIDEMYSRSEPLTCILLLHEMAHAVLEGSYKGHPSRNPGHGMVYQAELFRLFHAGAYDSLI